MQITKLEEGAVAPKPNKKDFTQEELQQEFDFILAEKIVRNMAEKGLITDDELRNRQPDPNVDSALKKR